jgi:hypothetical protein
MRQLNNIRNKRGEKQNDYNVLTNQISELKFSLESMQNNNQQQEEH